VIFTFIRGLSVNSRFVRKDRHGAISSSGSLRDGLEISVKCHVQRENHPFDCKDGLSVGSGSNDSDIPKLRTASEKTIRTG